MVLEGRLCRSSPRCWDTSRDGDSVGRTTKLGWGSGAAASRLTGTEGAVLEQPCPPVCVPREEGPPFGAALKSWGWVVRRSGWERRPRSRRERVRAVLTQVERRVLVALQPPGTGCHPTCAWDLSPGPGFRGSSMATAQQGIPPG